MKYLPKIALGFLIFILFVLIILFSAAFLMQDKVTGIILNNLNKNISTQIVTGPVRLSFIRSFPKATVVMKQVLVHSSPGINSADFGGLDTDTLLFAKSISLVLNPLEILKGRYDIEMISVKSGFCRLLSDKGGIVNYKISTSENSSEKPVPIDLQKILLSDVRTSYLNIANKLSIWGTVESGNLKSRISGDNIDFTAKSEMTVDSFRIGNIAVNSHLSTALDLKMNSTAEGITFSKSSLKIDKSDYTVEGTISSGNVCNLAISGNDIDLKNLGHYLPAKYKDIISQYNPSGKLIAVCNITGQVTKTRNPRIELNGNVDNGSVSYRHAAETINNISFSCHYTNGSAGRAETSLFTVGNLKFIFGSSQYSGSLQINNFTKPVTEISLAGKVYPSQLRDFFGIRGLPVAEGSVDVSLNFKSDHPLKDQFTKENFSDHIPEGNLVFNSFSLGGIDEKTVFRHVNGQVTISDKVTAKNLVFDYKGHRIGVTGEFRNLVQWALGRQVTLVADADLQLDNILYDSESDGSKETPSTAVNFPSDMIFNIRLSVDRVRFKTFSSTGLTGIFNYKPKLLTFKSLNMNTLDGIISGDGFISRNANKTIISRGNFKINSIDVKKTFVTFNNFGQKFIVADNLSGSLSGTVSVLMPMDSMFMPKAKNVTAEGRFTLINGALINFEPVKQLSSFIELSELENIHFDKLENDFFIRNNVLFLPQMEVRSSAADLTVAGQHTFDNNYEYHVRMLLSELLSKKRRGMKKPVTEFGAVQDDGLGRTAILLKVVNKGEDVKVSYDLKAAGAEIKNNIRNEKKNLKTILNEEYGPSRGETGKQTELPVTDKKRFKVTWSETDSVPPASEQEQSKEGGFKSLFRKK